MKDELRLAYKTGALSIINRPFENGIELDEATKKKAVDALEEEFEAWYKALAPLFALVSNEV